MKVSKPQICHAVRLYMEKETTKIITNGVQVIIIAKYTGRISFY